MGGILISNYIYHQHKTNMMCTATALSLLTVVVQFEGFYDTNLQTSLNASHHTLKVIN